MLSCLLWGAENLFRSKDSHTRDFAFSFRYHLLVLTLRTTLCLVQKVHSLAMCVFHNEVFLALGMLLCGNNNLVTFLCRFAENVRFFYFCKTKLLLCLLCIFDSTRDFCATHIHHRKHWLVEKTMQYKKKQTKVYPLDEQEFPINTEDGDDLFHTGSVLCITRTLR